MCSFNKSDVMRHPLVYKIVSKYEKNFLDFSKDITDED